MQAWFRCQRPFITLHKHVDLALWLILLACLINKGPSMKELLSLSNYCFQTERKPVISVFNAVTGETLPIMGSVFLLRMSVSRLKTMVSLQSGLPVSAFRLSTSAGVQLYDCNRLHDYDIEVGTVWCFYVLGVCSLIVCYDVKQLILN